MTMKMGSRLAAVAMLVVTGLSILAPSEATPRALSAACSAPAKGIVPVMRLTASTNAIACDLVGRKVDFGNAVLSVPKPGQGISMHARRTDGDVTFTLDTDRSGQLQHSVLRPGKDQRSATEQERALATPACSDSVYARTGWYFSGADHFAVGDGAMPAGGTRAQFATAVKAAFAHNTGSQNDCNLTDQVSASAVYAGYTSTESDIAVNAQGQDVCTANDGTNTLDYGPLAAGDLGLTCTFYTNNPGTQLDPAFESDTRLSNAAKWSYGAQCTPTDYNYYDIESVLTHEIGHTYGLDDIYTAAEAELTMYGYGTTCSSEQRTLARGDVLGLRSIY